MTHVVTLPDGSTASFPDDMSDADVTAAIQQQQTPQMAGGWRQPALYGSAAAEGAAQGAEGIMNTPMNPFAGPLNAALDYGRSLLPQGSQPQFDAARQTMQNPLTTLLRSAGVIDRPDLIPQNAGERYGTAATRGVAAAAPSMFGGEGNLIGRGIQTLMQGIGGGVGAQAGTDLTAPQPGQEPSWASKVGPMIGSLIGSLGAGTAYTAGNKAVGAATGVRSPVLTAYDNLDITPRLAGDVSGNPVARTLQSSLKIMPGGVGPLTTAANRTVGEFGDALENTANWLGNSRTEQQAGDALQMHGDSYLDRFRQGNATRASTLDMHIPASTPTPLTNYETTLNNVRTDMPNAQAHAAVLEPTLTSQLLDALTTDTRIPPRNTGLLNAQGNPIITPASTRPLTWQDAQGIRRQIGERLADPATYLDPGAAKLSALYKALSTDQEAVAASTGQPALDAFNDARDFARTGHEFIDTTLSRISRGNAISPEQATQNMLTGGASNLQQLRANMPQAADELAAYKLRDMGLSTAGKQNATNTRVSPTTFGTDSANLAFSPEAFDALYGANPAVANRVRDLRTVASTMRDTEALSNTSHTAGAAGWMHSLSPVAALEAARQGYEIGGWPGAAVGVAAPFLPGMVGSRLLTSPAVNRYVASPGAGGRVPQSLPAALGAAPYWPPGLLQ